MMLLDAGSFGDAPWWVFLMMPLMMLGMGLMMWLMMRMMMGDHGASPGSTDSPAAARGEEAADSEVASLRQQLAELQRRLATVEARPRGQDDDERPPPDEGGAPASGKGERP